jgi:hypothetical protein
LIVGVVTFIAYVLSCACAAPSQDSSMDETTRIRVKHLDSLWRMSSSLRYFPKPGV